MYKLVRRLGTPFAALCLTAATVFSSAGAFRAASPGQALGVLGALFTSPIAAARAAGDLLDGQVEPARETAAPAAPSAEEDAAPVPSQTQQDVSESTPPQEQTAVPQAPAQPSADEPVEARSPVAGETVPEGMAPLLEQHFLQGSGPTYIPTGPATIRNCTSLPDSEVAAEVGQPLPFQIELGSSQPQVLIMHTHATECYESQEHSWCDPSFSARTTDTSSNMVAVGEEMTAVLNAAGVNTIHDTTLHDYPSYTGSYEYSNQTVRDYLARYPSIKVVLDVHRDAIQRQDGTRVKPVATLNGQKSAQVMIICGADNGGNLPNFKQNLRFASAWQARMESLYPGLTRPVLFDYRYYNQDLTTGSLLIEVGGHANTLQEAKNAGRMAAQALASLFAGN